MDFLKRAVELQTELEELLGLDADTEIQGGIDDATKPPTPCVMLTETAAKRAIERLREERSEQERIDAAVEAEIERRAQANEAES